MNGLSFGVIRVNTEDKNSALTVQDVGHVMPGGKNGQESPVRALCEWSGAWEGAGQRSLPCSAAAVGEVRQPRTVLLHPWW